LVSSDSLQEQLTGHCWNDNESFSSRVFFIFDF